MQNYRKTIGALAAASALVAGNASAEVEYEIHAGLSSAYIFRGLDLGDELAETGIDFSTEVAGLGVSGGLWYANWEAPVPGQPGFDMDTDELDIYAEVSKDLGFATVAVGYIYYIYDQANGNAFFNPFQDQQEVYFSLAKEFFGVDFSLAYFWDIETDNDGYTELGASKGFELSPCLTLNTGATLGYLFEESEFSHLQTKVSLDWAFTETATLSPYLAASWGLTNEAGNTHTASDEELFGGVSLAVSF